ncbi:hypothetical protein BH10PSE6_BH10PSE6_50640 [soil metagenome]
MNPLLRELVRAWRLAETSVLKPILDWIGLANRPRYRGVDRVDVEGGLMPDREPAVLEACSAGPRRNITRSLPSALLATAGRCLGPITRTKEQ